MSETSPLLESPNTVTVRRWAFVLLIAAATSAITANVFTAEPLQSANDRSRWCTVESLLSEGTYVIDAIDADPRWSTIDKVRHEGHFYSTKPPLLPTLVAGVTWCVERVTGLDLRDDPRDVMPWVLVIVNVLPLLLALIAVAWFAERFATSDFTRLFVVVTAAFGTLLVPFAATLNNHSVAACSVMLVLVAAARILLDGDRSPWTFAACGFLAMFTCTNELPAAAFGVAVFVLLHLKAPRRTWLAFVPAALIPLIAYLGLNVLVTGGLKPFYAYYGTEKYEFIHQGVPSYWMRPTGIDTNRDSPAMYLVHCLVGHHGILLLSPVFVLTVITWVRLPRWRRDPLATLSAVGAGLTLAVLAFYLSRTSNYNYGGISAGLRWTIWLVPFWLIALIPALDRCTDPWCRRLAIAALGVSVFSAWYNARTPWEQPWAFVAMENAEWIDYSDPPPELDVPLQTWFGSIPDPADGPASVTFRSRSNLVSDFDGDNVLDLQLTAVETMPDGRRRVEIEVGGESTEITLEPTTLRSDAELKIELDVDPDDADAWQAWLRGLPAATPFRATAVQYVRMPLRRDAFECTKAFASIDYRATEDAPFLRYYCETWLSDEIPFGCAKFVTTISDPATGEIIEKRTWIAIEATGF